MYSNLWRRFLEHVSWVGLDWVEFNAPPDTV